MKRRFLLTMLGALLLTGGAAAVIAALIGLGISRSGSDAPPTGHEFVAAPTATLEPVPTATVLPTPTPIPPSSAPIERLVIDRIGVDAPVIVLGVDPDGTMQSPKTPTAVAWYHFTSKPGFGGNVVFAAHVDYINYGRAVFWYLSNLSEGDEVKVRLLDGTEYVYRVISNILYNADAAPIAEIVGPTPTEAVTLITCGGNFDPVSHQYDRRRVVRAELVPAATARSQ